MFLLRISLFDRERVLLRDFRGLITSATNELQTDFYTALAVHEGGRAAEGLLIGAARWSEPVLSFVARCIDAVELGGDLALPPYSNGLFSVTDVRRGMREVAGFDFVPEPRHDDVATVQRLWRNIRDRCLIKDTGTVTLPPLPSPLAPPVYDAPGGSYCRLADLPIDARTAAAWVLPRRGNVTGVPDAVLPAAMHAFLCNEAEIPRPFFGWVWP